MNLTNRQPTETTKPVKEQPNSTSLLQVKCQDGVSYVEAEDCHTVAFVRCTDSKAAQTLVDKKIWQKAEVLEGLLISLLQFL